MYHSIDDYTLFIKLMGNLHLNMPMAYVLITPVSMR